MDNRKIYQSFGNPAGIIKNKSEITGRVLPLHAQIENRCRKTGDRKHKTYW